MKTISEIAKENGLELVETTSGTNGYPSDVMDGVTGFKSFAEAEKVASENGLDLICIEKRDGWKLWCRGNNVTSAFAVSEDSIKALYIIDCEGAKDILTEQTNEERKDMLADTDMDDGAERNSINKYYDEIVKAIANCPDNMKLAVYGMDERTDGYHTEYVEKDCMGYSYDGTSYAIAAVRYFQD